MMMDKRDDEREEKMITLFSEIKERGR